MTLLRKSWRCMCKNGQQYGPCGSVVTCRRCKGTGWCK